MPELPEVETTRRGIAPYLEGQTCQAVDVRDGRLRWPVPDGLSGALTGATFRSVTRRGKYLLFATSAGTLLVHLGMSGSLRIVTQPQPPGKHDHIDLVFGNGTVLRFNDPRRFGAMLWTTGPAADHPLLKALGPEPLSAEFDGAVLHQAARRRKLAVKALIMDSHVVVGVGNIYANEALFQARILPARPAGGITLGECQALAESIRHVLAQAIGQGGTTLRNFVNESGQPGYFKQQLKVYGRGGEPCGDCGQTLQEIRLANRTTVFCPACQQ